MRNPLAFFNGLANAAKVSPPRRTFWQWLFRQPSRPSIGLPESVERVINKALERNPDDRYQSTIEFADAFEAAARNRSSGEVTSDGGILGKLFGR